MMLCRRSKLCLINLSVEVRPFIESLANEKEAMSVQVPWWNGEAFAWRDSATRHCP
ncbi:MAG: hypothetical protein JWN30_710 [Bacilli bacterium]|jgi:hypothetical protein|nr:hypothetical protein [Bacilli bacterium]